MNSNLKVGDEVVFNTGRSDCGTVNGTTGVVSQLDGMYTSVDFHNRQSHEYWVYTKELRKVTPEPKRNSL